MPEPMTTTPTPDDTEALAEWRSNRDAGWTGDIGYALQDTLRAHRYDVCSKGSKPNDPGWHVCTCGWEGYWSDFEPHVADHLRRIVAEKAGTGGGVREQALAALAPTDGYAVEDF